MASVRLVVLALLVAGCQCWEAPAVNQGRRAQYYVQKNDGSYHFGYDTAGGQFQTQQGSTGNEVRGQFSSSGGKVEYTAGVDGFVVKSHQGGGQGAATKTFSPAPANAAAARFATLEELTTLPKPVADTPEVAAAKQSFKAAYDAAAAAAEAAPDVNIITAQPGSFGQSGFQRVSVSHSEPVLVSGPQVSGVAAVHTGDASLGAPLDASGRVQDTQEVKAAKASFQAAYDAAAAAAEDAPDVNIITGGVPSSSFSRQSNTAPAAVQSTFIAPAAPVDASGRVVDTAEVKAAKASFKAAFDAAAAEAAAAPDTGIITGGARGNSFGTQSDFNTITGSAPVAPSSGANVFSAPTVQTSHQPLAIQRTYLAPAITGSSSSDAGAPLDASGRVDDTAEVKAAKASFKAAYDAAAAAAEAAPDTGIITGGARGNSFGTQSDFNSITGSAPVAPSSGANVFSAPTVQTSHQPLAIQRTYLAPAITGSSSSDAGAPLDASGRVDDTPEVKAAKASFKAAFDAAAAAAEAAPDTGIITASPGAGSSSHSAGASQQATPSFGQTFTFGGPTGKHSGFQDKHGYHY